MSVTHTLKTLFATAAAALFIGLPQAAQAALSDADIQRLDDACGALQTRGDAAMCLTPFYKRSMDMAENIWSGMHKNGSLDTSKMAPAQKNAYLAQEFEKQCLAGRNDAFTAGKTPEDYMRQAQICLSIATDTADLYGYEYDKDEASYLISRTRRLRHLDLSYLN